MVDVVVEHDYIAKAPNELTIKKGDVIRDVVRKQDGWCEGVLNEKRGTFPDKFIRTVDKESVVYRNKKDVSRIRRCRVAFSYKQDHEDELNLHVGDIIEVLGEEEEGWWRGVLNGKEGVFPSNFVVEIKNSGNKDDLTSTPVEEPKSPTLPPKPAKLLCEVKYAYKAQNSDELNLKEGDIVTIVSQEGFDPGWWLGELNGKTGVFPDNFVVVIQGSDDKHKNDKKQRTPQEPVPLKPSSIAAQRKSLELKTEKHEPSDPSNKTTPPLPSKKPILPIKKSPSGGTSGGGLFSGIKKKIVDAVDGSTASKNSNTSSKVVDSKLEHNNEHTAENAFDQVERRPLLSDVRATRAKAPGRRPPSVVFKEGEPGVMNGNTEHSTLDILTELSASDSSVDQETCEVKPRLREWEKHKAPWLEEMKLNQAKRTSTSPGPEQNKLKLTPTEKNESELSKTSPVERDEGPAPGRIKTPTNELDKSPVIRNKPIPIPSRPQTIHTINDVQKPKAGSPVSQFNRTPSPAQRPTLLDADGDGKDTISYKQYAALLERIEKLENLLEKQHRAHLAAIADLQGKLQVETDMRVMLQAELDKLAQCVMQV